MHCVDLGESFPTSIYLQHLASIQPRTSLVKFARSPRTDRPGNSKELLADSLSKDLPSKDLSRASKDLSRASIAPTAPAMTATAFHAMLLADESYRDLEEKTEGNSDSLSLL